MADAHHEYNDSIVLNRSDDSKIADAVSPKSFQVAGERASEPAWILRGRDTLTQVPQNSALRLMTELAQVTRRVGMEFDAPYRRRTHGSGSARSSRSKSSSAMRSPPRASRRCAR